jgi:hypothetical protein
MRRQGVPESMTTCMVSTLQEAQHQVRMAYRAGNKKKSEKFAKQFSLIAIH